MNISKRNNFKNYIDFNCLNTQKIRKIVLIRNKMFFLHGKFMIAICAIPKLLWTTNTKQQFQWKIFSSAYLYQCLYIANVKHYAMWSTPIKKKSLFWIWSLEIRGKNTL